MFDSSRPRLPDTVIIPSSCPLTFIGTSGSTTTFPRAQTYADLVALHAENSMTANSYGTLVVVFMQINIQQSTLR